MAGVGMHLLSFNLGGLMRLELALETSDQVALSFIEPRPHLAAQSVSARGAEVKIKLVSYLETPMFNPSHA